MEVSEQIQKFEEFIETHNKVELLERVRSGKKSLTIDFGELSKFNPEMAELILEQPEEILRAAELAIANFDLPGDIKGFRVRIKNLSPDIRMFIRNIRSTHLGKFFMVEGTVRQKSDVRPQVTSARFECPACGNIMNVLQLDSKFKEPTKCGCGRKGKFRMLSKELVDAQGIVLEESTKDLEGGEQPKRINVLLKDELVSPISEKKTNPGSSIRIMGIVKEVPIILRSGGQSTKFDIVFEANNVEGLEEDYTNIKITEEEEKLIIELSQDRRLFEKLAHALAPGIYGHDKIKEALLMQFVGGVRKMRSDGVPSRGDIHILLIGDPGSGKSMLLKRGAVVAPKARYVSGKGVSAAGLCIAPDSMVLTNPGGMESIQSIVDDRLAHPEKVCEGIWKQDDISDIKIQGLSDQLKIQSRKPKSIWKLKSPDKVFIITTSSGKRIELTPNTQLFTITDGITSWKKSSELRPGDYVATPRRLIGGDILKLPLTDLIKSNPVVLHIKPFVRRIVEHLVDKHGTIRSAAKHLGVAENNLYHNWVNEAARGNIKLHALRRIGEDAGMDWRQEVKRVSLYNGKAHTLPECVDADLAYLAGLIAGDGDMRKSGATYSIRLSNSNEELHGIFRRVISEQFGLRLNATKGNSMRPESSRTHSKLLAEILMALGIPMSPKSDKIVMSEHLLHLDNGLLSHYIAGLFDTDGSIIQRKTPGSDCIDLTTCSEKLARQIQLSLLRYGIHAKLRRRPPSTGRIQGKLEKWIVEIRGNAQFRLFAENIRLRHPSKKEALQNIISRHAILHSNIDVMPGLPERLRKAMEASEIPLRKYGWRNSLSRDAMIAVLDDIGISNPEMNDIRKTATSDIFWERISDISERTPEYPFVYDLTVEDSHNFVAEGILVHNTAAVVKDEFLSGWSLEAGAMVLANRGIVMIDELDKMSEEDTSAMHEALEQQSYHHDFEIMFADGRKEKIGEYVDRLMLANKNKIINSKDCEILELKDIRLLSTDFDKVFPITAARISRHSSPKTYYKVSFSNGRSITVTPEHPLFAYKEGEICEIPASQAKRGMIVPAVRSMPALGKLQHIFNTDYPKRHKKISLPKTLDPPLARLLGYILSEGHTYRNKKNRYAEIGVSNTDMAIVKDCAALFSGIFKTTISINKSFGLKSTKAQYTVRCPSIPLYDFFALNFSESLAKANEKRVPIKILASPDKQRLEFLRAYFKGDGFVNSERTGYSTSSYLMACDLQDMLLMQRIWSYIATENREGTEYHKVVVSGEDSLAIFAERIVMDDHRRARVDAFLDRSKIRRNARVIVPLEIVRYFNDFLKRCHASDGYFTTLVRRGQNSHRKVMIEYLENAKAKCRTAALKAEAAKFERMLSSDIRFITITSVEKKKDRNKWVYDVTVEPTRTFISCGIVLHNTISISKANIQATLRCETTVLAAANPKFGRFDDYQTIAKQIDMPPALINRFDLIFTIRDFPDEEKDKKMADFILTLHKKKSEIEEGDIDTNFLRKYLVYCKQKIYPKLTDSALEELKEYYLKMRGSGGGEGAIKSVSISARQLEALIRLAEAAAKIRLSDKVTKKDAQKAVSLLHYCLEQVGMDSETGKIDIDRIVTGIPASERSRIANVREIIAELEQKVGKMIQITDIMQSAEERGIDKDLIDEAIEKLKRSGDLFEPKKGFISRIM